MMGSFITEGNVLEEMPEDMAEYLASLEMVPSVLFMPYTMPVEDVFSTIFRNSSGL